MPVGTFSITSVLKKPRVPRGKLFARIKEHVLGKRYTLSLAFIGPNESRRLNKRYRGKNKAANVLSFPLEKNAGEILICPTEAKRQARAFGSTPERFVAELFIHGLFHLKGMSHGSTMERREAAAKKYFSF